MASYYHCSSTDSEPRHDTCPPGKVSWCFFQKAKAEGTTASHKDMKVKFILPPKDRAKVLKIYNDLIDDNLLSRCLLGKTQNPNECLHSKIWNAINKVKFFGLQTKYSVHYTILVHNVGHLRADLTEELGFGPISEIMKTYQKSKEYATTKKSMDTKPKSRKRKQAAGEEYAAGQY